MDQSVVIDISNEEQQQHSYPQITKEDPTHRLHDVSDSIMSVDQHPTEITVKTAETTISVESFDGEAVKSSPSLLPAIDNGEKVCRICYLSDDDGNNGDEDSSMRFIELGCACKDELGISHHRCAVAWFSLKKTRTCEICGNLVKNIEGIDEIEERIVRIQPMVERSNIVIGNNFTFPAERQRSRSWANSYCNFLLVCVVLSFFLPWFVHVPKPW